MCDGRRRLGFKADRSPERWRLCYRHVRYRRNRRRPPARCRGARADGRDDGAPWPRRPGDLDRRRRGPRLPPAGDHRPRRALEPAAAPRARCTSSSTARSTTTSSCARSCAALGHRFAHRRRRARCCCTRGRSGARARSTASTACSRSRVWDDRVSALTLASDPFAEKPLFYSPPRRAAWCSPPTSARCARPMPAIGIPDERAPASVRGARHDAALPATFFADVQRLPPAHLARWQGGACRTRRYWTRARSPFRLIHAAAARAARAAVRLGPPAPAQRRGGRDLAERRRRLLGASWRCPRARPRPRPSRVHGDVSRLCARRVALRRGGRAAAGVVQHHAVRPDGRSCSTTSSARSRPGGAVRRTSIYAQWRVMRAAREAGVTVLLDGQGADELFGGYAGMAGWALRQRGAGGRSGASSPTRAARARWRCGFARRPRALARRYRMRMACPYVPRAGGRAGRGERAAAWRSTARRCAASS